MKTTSLRINPLLAVTKAGFHPSLILSYFHKTDAIPELRFAHKLPNLLSQAEISFTVVNVEVSLLQPN